MVERLARAKAQAGLVAWAGRHGSVAGEGSRSAGGVVVIGADTTVVLGEESLGKPGDDAEAKTMLQRLSGRSHQVVTGVAVATVDVCRSAVDCSTVRFRALDDAEVEAYLASGEHRGKAGAYGIQGRAGLFVEGIEGSYPNIVGLPVVVLDALLQAVAGRPLRTWADPG
jgi:septum formation protein